MLTLSGIHKQFDTAVALDGADLSVTAGTVHGLLGENGAGKSTLMKVLFGLLRPDAGSMTLSGQAYRPHSPRDAAGHGIGMVHQHFTLAPTLSVRDNCVLAAGRGLGLIDQHAWDRRILALGERLSWPLDPDAMVGSLAVGQQQRVEIAKALLAAGVDASGPLTGRMLILDEPTAVLTPPEVEELLPAVRRLAEAGTTVLFISHKLPEVLRICDALTVLRGGRTVYTGQTLGMDAEHLADLMVGACRPGAAGRGAGAAVDAPVRLSVQALQVPGALHQVTFQVRAGEVVGIAGVDGNGQRELVRAILGLQADATGTIDTPSLPANQRLRGPHRIGVIPDDRQREALVLDLPLSENLALGDHRDSPLACAGWLLPAAWRLHAQDLVHRFGVRVPAGDVLAGALSGGNQQRAVVARALHGGPGLVVAVNPTRGLDIAASADVLGRLASARSLGTGVLLVHHDLDELLGISDRVLVLYGGVLVDSGWPSCERSVIGRLMMGLPAHA